MSKYLLIKADTNDADYTYSCNEITEEELIKIRPVVEAIKNFRPYAGDETSWNPGNYYIHRHNYPDQPRTDLGEKYPEEIYGHLGEGFTLFDEKFKPYWDDYGIHSIESVEVIEIVERLM